MSPRFLTASLLSALLVSSLATAPAGAIAVDPTSVSEDSDSYSAGTKAMNEHRWNDAVAAFDRVAEEKGRKTDAALYWKAYSLNKLGNRPMSMATCYQLRSRFASSQWNKDCSALSIDARAGGDLAVPPMPPIAPVPPLNVNVNIDGETWAGRGSDQDLKILALNSLLNRDPEKAIPLLRGILAGDQPEGVKRHAIFVLAQSKAPESQSILHDVVVGKMGPNLQREGIQMSAVFQGKRADDSLVEVYKLTSDRQVKRSVISALFISQDAPRMVELARSEKDLEMKRTIVSQLALMQDKAATDYMMELLK